jgi:hypothetical protein
MSETVPSKTQDGTQTLATPASAGSWSVAALIVGDALSFLVFTVSGRTSHNEAAGFAAAGQILATAFPFALAWFLVSPFAGAFRRKLVGDPRAMLFRTEFAWLCSYPVALVLRVIFSKDHQMPVTFAIVILLANALFLGLWRTVFAWATRQR